MAARLGAEHLAPAAPQRHRLVAVARVAGAFLLVHLLAGHGDLGAVLHVMGAGHALQELVAHHALNEVGARLKPIDGIAGLHLARALGIQCLDGGLHGFSSAPPSSAGASNFGCAAPAGLRKAPGTGASLGSTRFTASRTSTQPPLAPGTAPRMSKRPRSLSVSTTSRFCVVTRTSPMWPAIFLPLNTLPGSWRWPVEPWLRWVTDTPWLARRPAKFQRFIGPWKPLPWLVPVTSTI